MMSIGIVILVVDRVSNQRVKQNKVDELIALMRLSRDSAKEAIAILGGNKWLYDGSIKRALLVESDLTNLDLQVAELRGCLFDRSNLNGTRFDGAVLTGSRFFSSSLQATIFTSADLSYCNFITAKFDANTVFVQAILDYCDFSGSNITREQLNQLKSV